MLRITQCRSSPLTVQLKTSPFCLCRGSYKMSMLGKYQRWPECENMSCHSLQGPGARGSSNSPPPLSMPAFTPVQVFRLQPCRSPEPFCGLSLWEVPHRLFFFKKRAPKPTRWHSNTLPGGLTLHRIEAVLMFDVQLYKALCPCCKNLGKGGCQELHFKTAKSSRPSGWHA